MAFDPGRIGRACTTGQGMDFGFSDEQRQMRSAIERLCAPFDAGYWLQRDQDGRFPHDFHQALAGAGWLGVAMPAAFGGAGLGITEAALMMQTISATGAGLSGASAVHMNIFGLQPVVAFGSAQQQQRWLPPLIAGEHKACFAVTEPDAGLNTLKLKTQAVRDGEHYVVNGQKLWTSTAQVAQKMLLLARTTPLGQGPASQGLSLFYTDLDPAHVQVQEIAKMGRHCVDSNQVFIDGLRIPLADRIGDEGRGFEYLLHGLNAERILIAAEAVGLGQVALQRAAQYAGERIVFDRAIGQNQAIQHPLAKDWMALQAAELMVYRAAWLYDHGQPCGEQATSAKYLAAEAGYHACENAVLSHGGMGYAKAYHVERYLREAWIPRLAPVSQQLALCFIAEKVLGLPKSY